MGYIGKQPIVGNFQVCDAISVVNGQAAYTMQVNSTNVEPETAFHMLVSLNGILQKPGSSFTISGSTITFASNLATGDVIDFIILLGDVLNIGTPSDDTVTAAKLNNTMISGLTALTSAPDDTDEFLISDAGTLKRIDASLIGGGGKILQVVNNLDTTARSTTSSSFVDATGNSLDITPSATTSKVLLLYSAQGYKDTVNEGYVTIFRDSTNLSTVTGNYFSFLRFGSGTLMDHPTIIFLDSPNTTSQVTYQVKFMGDGSNAIHLFGMKSLIALEVGA